jgi:hypothetical protein
MWSADRWAAERWTFTEWLGRRWGAPITPIVTLAIVFPESGLHEITVFNLARGLVAARMSRAYFGFTQGATNYAFDFTHAGQGADCTVNTNVATYTRANIALSAGAKTAIEVATAAEVALGIAGVAGVSRVDNIVYVVGATGLVTGAAMSTDENVRGMYGRQRTDFGSAPATQPFFSAVNGTVSAHITSKNAAGRVLGVYILNSNGTRSGSMRMGFATGPAYSTTPAAFSDGQEGLVTRNGNVALLVFPEPISIAAAQDRWIIWKTNAAAAWGVETRLFAGTPVGNGDLTVNERVIIDATVTNPAVAIFTAGAYTVTSSATGQAYAAVGYIFEEPDGEGNYYGDGSLRTFIGRHGVYNQGTPSTDIGPTVLDGLADTPRMVLPGPWANSRLVAFEQGANAVSATEDFGVSAYDCSDSDPAVYPYDVVPTRIARIGRLNASTGAGYKRVEMDIQLSNVSVLGMFSTAGNIDGSIPATTITIVYCPRAGAGGTNAWLNCWVDARASWDDRIPERGGLGVNGQYVQTAGALPFGDPDQDGPTGPPDPMVTDVTDFTGENQPIVRTEHYISGIALAA